MKVEEDSMQASGFLFQKPSPNNVLANCGAGRDWPDARGIFHNKDKTFLGMCVCVYVYIYMCVCVCIFHNKDKTFLGK
jgi:hypothetical protein